MNEDISLIKRLYTKPGENALDMFVYKKEDVIIYDKDTKEIIFSIKDVEVPLNWSSNATKIVAEKYFKRNYENSAKQLVYRVANKIANFGKEHNYFDEEEAEILKNELEYGSLAQLFSFNSPVWFNCGTGDEYGIEEDNSAFFYDLKDNTIKKAPKKVIAPQSSACFINSVEDSMDSIVKLAGIEINLFKFGSGTGTNYSTLRAEGEPLSNGGYASGPVSFMVGYDAFAGIIKSGGKTRRAAKMAILNIDHPDVTKFIENKVKENNKAKCLINELKLSPEEAYASTKFNNQNQSVRVTDSFMNAVLNKEKWNTIYVKSKKIAATYDATDLFDRIAKATWECGDPGLQFHDTVNRWNTVLNDGEIVASNPCSEFMFLNNSACNLASINLLKYLNNDGIFEIEKFKHAVEILITSQDILVDLSSYPTEEITKNSHIYRPLGLGYANLGSLLMCMGLPYDSDEGRAVAASIAAIMTATAYQQSAKLASKLGPFDRYEQNKTSMMNVIKKHRDAVNDLKQTCEKKNMKGIEYLISSAEKEWDEAIRLGEMYGYRNAQTTLMAPTGTISFMMDCDTTGIEPEYNLVKVKKLSDNSLMVLVNKSMKRALKVLGYKDNEIVDIIKYVEENWTVEKAPHLKEEHLAIFDCANKPNNAKRYIHYKGHIKMMAALQPFLSGAISKTVNLPESATVDDIKNIYIEAWKSGLKAIAIYRDNCKPYQPLNLQQRISKGMLKRGERLRPADRRSLEAFKFEVGGHSYIVSTGFTDDENPQLIELFITAYGEGSTLGALFNIIGELSSKALQYGMPAEKIADIFMRGKFEPSGAVKGLPYIQFAQSPLDVIGKLVMVHALRDTSRLGELALKIKPSEMQVNRIQVTKRLQKEASEKFEELINEYDKNGLTVAVKQKKIQGSICKCGGIMEKTGTCEACPFCGSTGGCS